jgi:hypothetical protein
MQAEMHSCFPDLIQIGCGFAYVDASGRQHLLGERDDFAPVSRRAKGLICLANARFATFVDRMDRSNPQNVTIPVDEDVERVLASVAEERPVSRAVWVDKNGKETEIKKGMRWRDMLEKCVLILIE